MIILSSLHKHSANNDKINYLHIQRIHVHKQGQPLEVQSEIEGSIAMAVVLCRHSLQEDGQDFSILEWLARAQPLKHAKMTN